jgi:hypothetical protein
VILSDNIVVPPLRERDKVVMEEVIRILPSHQWVSFNRARKYFRVYFMSQLLLSDGQTVDPSALIPGSTRQSSFRFPREEPTAYDFELWRATIKTITSPSFILSPPLGMFLCRCVEFNEWQLAPSKKYLVHTRPSGQYDIFIPMACKGRTRRDLRFVYTRTPPKHHRCAPQLPLLHNTLMEHSSCTPHHLSMRKARKQSIHPSGNGSRLDHNQGCGTRQ